MSQPQQQPPPQVSQGPSRQRLTTVYRPRLNLPHNPSPPRQRRRYHSPRTPVLIDTQRHYQDPQAQPHLLGLSRIPILIHLLIHHTSMQASPCHHPRLHEAANVEAVTAPTHPAASLMRWERRNGISVEGTQQGKKHSTSWAS